MVDKNYTSKADEFMAKGHKKLKGICTSGVLSFLGSKAERAETAMELFKNAATNYKLAKSWEQASKAFQECAYCDRLANGGQEAEFLTEAANMIEKINTSDAIKFYEQVCEIYCKESRIANAAKIKKQIAEMYERDLAYELAAKYFNEAAEFFYTEQHHQSDYHKCKVKVADLNILTGDDKIVESIKIYEEIAKKYLETPLLRPSAKNLFFQSCLLYLALDDTVGCQKALDQFIDMEPMFNGSREQKFISVFYNIKFVQLLLKSIMKALNSHNISDFSEECYQFNEVIPLDKWKTNVLTKIKGYLEKPSVLKEGTQENNPYI